jgi:hypothetical protein
MFQCRELYGLINYLRGRVNSTTRMCAHACACLFRAANGLALIETAADIQLGWLADLFADNGIPKHIACQPSHHFGPAWKRLSPGTLTL